MGTEADKLILRAFLTEAYRVLGFSEPDTLAGSLVSKLDSIGEWERTVREIVRTCNLVQTNSPEWHSRCEGIRGMLAAYAKVMKEPDEDVKFPKRETPLTQAEEWLWAKYINSWETTEMAARRAAEHMDLQLQALESCSMSFAEFFDLWDCPEDSPFDE